MKTRNGIRRRVTRLRVRAASAPPAAMECGSVPGPVIMPSASISERNGEPAAAAARLRAERRRPAACRARHCYSDSVRLDGVISPICTPFDQDGEIQFDAVRRNIAAYNRAGLLGYVVAGSTGEAVFLSKEEKRSLFAAVREAAGGKVLIAGTGAESVRETLSQIRDAAGVGYDAALVITPHYYRGQMARPETQIAFFRAVADVSPLPIVIYDFPQMTGIDLTVDMVATLAAHPNIVGIK